MEEWIKGRLLHAKFYPVGRHEWGRGGPKTENLTQFQNINAPLGAYLWRFLIFFQIELNAESQIKIMMDSFKEFQSNRGLKFGVHFPHIFGAF